MAKFKPYRKDQYYLLPPKEKRGFIFTLFLASLVFYEKKCEKRGQIYFPLFLGLPCPLHSIRLPIFLSTSSINRLLPVSWPLCNASRINAHSPSGIEPFTNCLYLFARSLSVFPKFL